MKLPIILAALLLAGCTSQRRGDTIDSVAETKRSARAAMAQQQERENAALRLSARNLYVNDHPEMPRKIRKAILNERLSVGMTVWQAVAAYSLWEYTNDPTVAKYKAVGAPALWTLVDTRKTGTGQTSHEQWVLMRKNDTQYVLFENGTLKSLKD